MRIAQCLEYSIAQHGGTEVLVRELIAGLSPRHEVILVSNDSEETLNNSTIAPFVRSHIHWQPERASRAEAARLARQLAAEKPDFAHFHFGGTFAWSCRRSAHTPPVHLRRQGIKSVVTNHGVFGVLDGYIGPQRSLVTKLALLPAAWLSRMRLLASIRAEVAVSLNDYHALCRRYGPMRGKFRQIYHSRVHEREPVIERSRTRTILCAGTIGVRKGQIYLAQAFAKLAPQFPDWNLVFVGRSADDAMAAELTRRCAALEAGGRMRWIGGCTDAELKEWFQTVEIYAMPSLHEGLGLTLQEALYYGCACIASRIGGIPDLLQHGENGILVAPANVGELASGLQQMMSDSALRAKFQARAHSSVLEKNMTAERMVARYEALYDELFAHSSR